MENEFPFIAVLTKRTRIINPQEDIICTASLISSKDILTAEHCVRGEGLYDFQVIVGSSDVISQSKYYPGWWITYEPWAYALRINNGHQINDIAIIRVINLLLLIITTLVLKYLLL
jgi:secreted trypsin-like serine protease